MSIRLCELVIAQDKSKIKAGEGQPEGGYKFFTSSNTQTKYVNFFQYDKPALIFGTGGMPSIHYCDEPFSTSTDCIVFYSKNNNYSLKSLYLFFESHMKLLKEGFHGAGLQHISKKYILDIQIPNIPIDKQLKINDIGDKLNRLIDLRKKQLEKYDSIVKSRFIEMFGDPVTNSKNIIQLTLTELGKLGRGVSKHRPRNAIELLGGQYPLIQTGDVANADLYIKEYSETYSEFGLNQSKMWDKGTLCITIAANIAKTAILNFDACFPDSIVGFNANSLTNNIYIHYWFSFFQEILEKQAPESAQKNINLKVLSELKVIVPILELQNEFVEFVQAIDKSKFECSVTINLLKSHNFYKYFQP